MEKISIGGLKISVFAGFWLVVESRFGFNSLIKRFADSDDVTIGAARSK